MSCAALDSGLRCHAHIHAHFGTNSAEVAMLVTALRVVTPFSFTVHGPE